MRRKNSMRKRKALTLVEIIIIVLFFTVASIYVIKLFLASEELNFRASQLDQAVFSTITLFEEMPLDGYDEYLISMYGDQLKQSEMSVEETYYMYLDKSFAPISVTSIDRHSTKMELIFYSIGDIMVTKVNYFRWINQEWIKIYEARREKI